LRWLSFQWRFQLAFTLPRLASAMLQRAARSVQRAMPRARD